VEGAPTSGAGAQADLPGRGAHRGARATRRFRPRPLGAKISGDCAKLAAQLGTGDPVLRLCAGAAQILYTTNAIESLNAQVRKAVRVRGHFPSEEAATKLIWLVLRNVQARWKNPPISWQAAKAQLAIQFEERFLLTD
jgi:putative transposase